MDIDSPTSVRGIVRSSLCVSAGVVLIVHGLGHAALAYAGSALLSAIGTRVLFGAACSIAIVGFVIGGLSLAGARPPDRPWRGRTLTMLALVASVVAFAMARVPEFWPGLLLDGLIAVALFSSSRSAASGVQRDRSMLRSISTITAGH